MLDLEPGDESTVRLVFSVEHPANVVVMGL